MESNEAKRKTVVTLRRQGISCRMPCVPEVAELPKIHQRHMRPLHGFV